MPNRILREGILTSERVARLNWPDEVFYRRLMSVVDDFGRYHANPKLLRAACYPLLIDKVSDADVGKWLTSCVNAALVSVYPAPDGKRYLQMLDFRQQARAANSKFPQMSSECVADAEHTQADAPVFGDGVGDVVDTPKAPKGADGRFEEFWSEYPRKVGKDAARKAFDKRKPDDALLGRMLAAIAVQRLSAGWVKEGGQFIPHPSTWLNEGRWQDAERVEISAPTSRDAENTQRLLADKERHAEEADLRTPEQKAVTAERLRQTRLRVAGGSAA